MNIDPENSLVLMETNLPTLSARVYVNLPEGIPLNLFGIIKRLTLLGYWDGLWRFTMLIDGRSNLGGGSLILDMINMSIIERDFLKHKSFRALLHKSYQWECTPALYFVMLIQYAHGIPW